MRKTKKAYKHVGISFTKSYYYSLFQKLLLYKLSATLLLEVPEIISNAQLSPDRHCNRRVRLSKARGTQARSCLSATAALYVQSAKLTTVPLTLAIDWFIENQQLLMGNKNTF